MKEKDAAIIKVLSDIGYTDEPELTTEQENQFSRALDPEKQFLYDVERLFVENIPDDDALRAAEEATRDTPSVLPMAPPSLIASLADATNYVYTKAGDWKGLMKMSTTESIPISKIIGSEEYLNGEHVDALAKGERQSVDLPMLMLFTGGRYVLMDGNHKVAAAKVRGDKNIKSLVFDIKKL